jgi:hypothetical protein
MYLAPPEVIGSRRGNVLLIVIVLLGISMLMVSGLSKYAATGSKLNQRNNDYYGAVAASEAATEKVLGQIFWDYKQDGQGYVMQKLSTYRRSIPISSEAAQWANYSFFDLSGRSRRVEVDYTQSATFQPLGGAYGQLKAFKDNVRVLSVAQANKSLDGLTASVYQDLELTRIPIFQYAMFYNILMEVTPLPAMVITGPVHANADIYLNPSSTLNFVNDLTSAGTIHESYNPASPLAYPAGGTISYGGKHDSGTSTLSLPIGTNNSPAAVQQVIQVPPAAENASSSLGQQRYYNKADLIIMISNTTYSARSGLWDSFAISLPTNDVFAFVSTNVSFYNKREGKTVQTTQIDVAKLVQYNLTNTLLRPYLPVGDIRTIFVADFRTTNSSTEPGIRLINGSNLPPQGLTIATPDPLYIWGDYNVGAGGRGTTNTVNSKPASIAADAVTILSTVWSDANSSRSLSSRIAADTTVNAAFLTGIVATTGSSDSGGVENYPRFLEDWSATPSTLTYNGSMVAMFYSAIANGLWKGIGSTYDIYNPPIRKWSLDQNFQYGDKLPPATPSLTVLVRSKWRTPAAYTTNIMAGF